MAKKKRNVQHTNVRMTFVRQHTYDKLLIAESFGRQYVIDEHVIGNTTRYVFGYYWLYYYTSLCLVFYL